MIEDKKSVDHELIPILKSSKPPTPFSTVKQSFSDAKTPPIYEVK